MVEIEIWLEVDNNHSSEKRDLHSNFWPREILQYLCLCKLKPK